MKSVILKSLVLMGVIGTSCFLVYQAKDGLPGVSSTPNNEEFTSLDAELGEAVPWGGSPSGEVAQPSDSIATSEKPDSFLNQLAPPNQIDESPEESLPASADDSSLAIGQFQWQSLETQTSEENHETVDVEPTPAINPFAEQPGRLIANTSPSKEDSSKLPEPRIEKSGHTMPLFFSPNKTEEAKEESPESETVAKNESPEQSEEQPEPTLAETAPQPEVDPFAFPGAEPAPIPKQEDEAPPVASSVSMSEGITGLESPDSTAEPKDPGSTMAPEEVVDVFAGLVPQQPEGDLEASSVAHAESSTPVPESGSPQSASDEDQFSAIELNSPPSDQSIGRVALPSSVEIDAGEEPSSPNLMPVGDSSARPIADNSEGPVGEIGPLTEIGAPRNRSPRAMAFGPHQGGETTQSQNPTTILEEPQLASERPRREGAFGPSVEPPPKKTEVLPSEDNLPARNRQRFTDVTE
ncbi:MAG: hypothetical protein KDA80_20870, partial [Planctomycetaceae bacterium]|nr:hypothetical protein [Planctomycetaceae bacterium]